MISVESNEEWGYTISGEGRERFIKRPSVETLQKQIRKAMVDKGIRSQGELARRAGINPNTFDNFFKTDRKNSLYADDLLLVADALETPMEELLTGEKKVPKSELQDWRAQEIAELLRHVPPAGLDALLVSAQAMADSPALRNQNQKDAPEYGMVAERTSRYGDNGKHNGTEG